MSGNILFLGNKIFEIPPFFQTRPWDLGRKVHACSLRFSALKPAVRSERERKSKTVSNGWPSGLCVPQLIIYTYLTFSAPSPHPWPLDKDNTASVEGEERLPPRFWHRWFYFCSRLVGNVISLFAPPLPFQQVARGVGRRDRQRFQTVLLAPRGGGYSHIWAI